MARPARARERRVRDELLKDLVRTSVFSLREIVSSAGFSVEA